MITRFGTPALESAAASARGWSGGISVSAVPCRINIGGLAAVTWSTGDASA